MKKFIVNGMSCAACQNNVTKAVSKIPNIKKCDVSLLTNTMIVEGDINVDEVITAVKNAGYEAKLVTKSNNNDTDIDSYYDKHTNLLKNRLIISILFLVILMYFAMGHNMLNLRLPQFFNNNPLAIGILQMLITIIIMIINKNFFISGFRSLTKLSPNMDTLVSLGSGVSFIWSTYIVFLIYKLFINNNIIEANQYLYELYFESSAMILVLITVGKMLESKSKGKTTNAIKSLMKLRPNTVIIVENNIEKEVDINDIKVGDNFIVKPGGYIPVDGKIIEGNTSIDESSLTGESIPIDKKINDNIYSGTLNQYGYIKCVAIKVGEDTVISKIINLVKDISITKAPIAKLADKISGIFVPIVILISLITFVIWLLIGVELSFALERAISVLVISCPCALGLATPVAIMVGNGVGAKNGILFKTAEALEETGKINIIAFDKTGTITNGNPIVTHIIPLNNVDEKELLSIAYSLEKKSEHPISKAIVKKCEEKKIQSCDITNFVNEVGNGLSGNINDDYIIGGSIKFISSNINIDKNIIDKINELSLLGETPILFAKNKNLIGIISISDTIKNDAKIAIEQLNNMGISTIMLTGDNINTAENICKKAGIKNVMAGILPDEKQKIISELKKYGKIAMVGDGINDAPSLMSADIGIAIGSGTDIAINSSDVVLVSNKLINVPSLIRLSKEVLIKIKQNLFYAFIYNVICIPLAAGCFIKLGLKLNPMIGAACMSLSSFFVVTNALRLNLINIYDENKYKNDIDLLNSNLLIKYINEINEKKELKFMKKTIIIEGMMCEHCEMHVKKALLNVKNVKNVEANHESGKAIVTLSEDVDDLLLKNAVIEAGYEVKEIIV